MTRLINVHKLLIAVFVFFILLLIILLICLLTLKVEETRTAILQVNADGTPSVIVDAELTSQIRTSHEVVVNYHNDSFAVGVQKITPLADGNYTITLDGLKDLLPGSKIYLTITTGHKSLISSVFSN